MRTTASTPTRGSKLLVALVAITVLAVSCGSDGAAATDDAPNEPTTTQPDQSDQAETTTVPGREADTGTIDIRLEEVEGIFIEGFEIGLRFETADGDVLASTLWSDFVTSAGSSAPDAFYTSVLSQPVPTGDVVVLATVNIGAGPPPVVPELDGEMDCRLEVTVPAGDTIAVEVSFADADCLRLVG